MINIVIVTKVYRISLHACFATSVCMHVFMYGR